MLTIEADTPPVEYESFGIRPKHIEVLPLAEGSAAALY